MPRAPRSRPNNLVSMPMSRSPEMVERDIARRAYELYEARGATHGHDLDDWLTAERELRETIAITAA